MLRDRLDVRPMAKIELMIVPPVDGSGHAWQVRLAKRDPIAHALRPARSGDASPSGAWAAGPIEAGDYVVTIASAGTQFHRRDLVVDAASDLQVIVIDAVPVRGHVRLGKIPVKAQVTLGNWNGEKATALAGDDGDFATLVPGAGNWYADVRLPSGQELHVNSIEIRRRDGEESARADITLPGGRIEGRVVDERGNGVTAGVIITRDGRPLTDIRAEDGDFALAGIEPGPATIEAQAKDAWSGPVNVEITEETQPVTLVIRKLRRVAGWLATSAGIPVAGASIRYRTSSSTFLGEAASSPSGRFELVLAPDDTTVDLAVVAPAFGAKLVRATVPAAGERIDVVMSGATGRLLVRTPDDAPPWPQLGYRGVWTALVDMLARPIAAGAPPWMTPDGIALDVEPGEYTICAADHAACVTQLVAAGTSSIVTVPRRKSR